MSKIGNVVILVEIDATAAPLAVDKTGVRMVRKILRECSRAPAKGDRLTLHYDMNTWEHIKGTVKDIAGTAGLRLEFSYTAEVSLDDTNRDFPKLCELSDWENLPVHPVTKPSHDDSGPRSIGGVIPRQEEDEMLF